MADNTQDIADAPGADFREAFVEADSFTIRYLDSGPRDDDGDALICLHGAGGVRLSGAHDLLAERFRVIAFEEPGFGTSAANQSSETLRDLAITMNRAVTALGIEEYNLMGNSFGAKLALWMAVEQPGRVQAVVLVASAAIRGDDWPPPSGTPAEIMALMHAHPERQPPGPALDAEIDAKQRALAQRLIGPPRDGEFEAKLEELDIPVLALFGTHDRVILPEIAGIYAALLPDCHVVMVYDTAHAVDADRPEAVASVAGDFIARHGRFLVTEKSGLLHP